MRSFAKGRLALSFAALILFLLANAWVAWHSIRQLVIANDWQQHTYQVRAQSSAILSAMQDVETGTRGYVLTGSPDFLQPYQTAQVRLPQQLDRLTTLIRDNPVQHPRVARLRQQVQAKLAISQDDIRMRARSGLRFAQEDVASRRGKAAMDAIRGTIAAIQSEEAGLLAQREARVKQSEDFAFSSLLLFAVSSLFLLSLVFLEMARAQARRAELAEAYAQLKRLEGLRDSLTAMLVHDLRTPLTTLLGPLDMLAADTLGHLDSTQSEMVNISRIGGYRLLGLINELLDISKMEEGQLQVRRDTVRIAVVVEDAVREVVRLDLGETARIERDLPDDLPLVQADQELLTRVLINLLGNALKFTPASGTITVSARHTDSRDARLAAMPKNSAMGNDKNEREDVVLVSVRDTGEGIPQSELGRIFDKFGQVESRKGGRKMSTGLGLTFCKLAVEAHGGQIWVESEIGRGSDFKFTVPLRPWADKDEVKEAAEAAAAVEPVGELA